MKMAACINCRYFVRGTICAAPQLVDLARLLHGEPLPGACVDVLAARLNQSLCGTPGYWFAANPPEPPKTVEIPATAP